MKLVRAVAGLIAAIFAAGFVFKVMDTSPSLTAILGMCLCVVLMFAIIGRAAMSIAAEKPWNTPSKFIFSLIPVILGITGILFVATMVLAIGKFGGLGMDGTLSAFSLLVLFGATLVAIYGAGKKILRRTEWYRSRINRQSIGNIERDVP